jgi:2-polyprenyl-3-methyl-5-hydroxy-6-metoxy-1,4-benzoquinol methylase
VWVCPQDKSTLALDEGRASCGATHVYTVRAGIPRFVPESSYTDHFGLQWNVYTRTQLDSYTGRPITRERLRRVLGPVFDALGGKHVLECGCGAGRFTEILLQQGADVTSIDLSSAVDANARNFPIGERHHVAQADIMALPLSPKSFDVVLCLGVIQHTPSPEAAIAELYRCVAPGGVLAIDHYTHSLRWYTTLAPLFRQILRRLPPQASLRITRALVFALLPLHKRFMHNRPVRALLSRISPVQCYYNEYPQLDDDLQREWALLDTHDSLTDWYKHLRSRRSIRRTLEQLGLEQIWCERGGNGIEARGTRPL